jgi:hypothetical protein
MQSRDFQRCLQKCVASEWFDVQLRSSLHDELPWIIRKDEFKTEEGNKLKDDGSDRSCRDSENPSREGKERWDTRCK